MAYASACDVAALTLNLLDSSASFDALTKPTSTMVTSWLSTGCAVIESTIGQRGYSAIPTNSVAYGLASQANTYFAAWQAELSRSSARVAQGERTRADMFKKSFDGMLDILKTLDLSQLGVGQSGQTYSGGISISDKATVEGDGDRVQPRFTSGQYRNPYALRPSVNSSAS